MSTLTRHFHPVLPARELQGSPVAATIDGQRIVLFRDSDGKAAALDDTCPHRFAPLSKGRVRPDGRLACPYHGWNFDRTGAGASPHLPDLPNCRTRSWAVREKHGVIFVGGKEVEHFPAMDWPDWQFAGHVSTLFPAPLHVCVDNFSEDEHTPWVHHVLGWKEEDATKVHVETTAHESHVSVLYRRPQRPSPWLPLLGVKSGDTFVNDWETHFDPVRTAYNLSWRDPKTDAPRPLETRFLIFFVPETPTTTRYHTFLYVRIRPSVYQYLAPLVKAVAMHLGRNGIADDARFIATVAETPFSFQGMRLTKFDRAIIHNHRLLQRVYRGEAEAEAAK